MTDATPAQAATPEPQAGDGKQTEPEQPIAGEQAQPLTLEGMRAELEAARKDAAKYRTQLRQQEKAAAEADAKRMAEQGEYKALYESVRAKAEAADALQERLDAITAQAQAANERRVKAIPEHMRSLVPAYDDPLKVAEWLDANAAIFSKPAAPPLDGRAGGTSAATVTDEDVIDFAVRMGIRPEHVDRATLAKALKR